MSSLHKVNDHHTIAMELNVQNGLMHLYVLDPRVAPTVDRDFTDTQIDHILKFLEENDHIYVINMINNMYL
jgi:hypothetical protein